MDRGLLGIPSQTMRPGPRYEEYGPFSAALSSVVYLAQPLGRDCLVNVVLRNRIAEGGYVPGDIASNWGGSNSSSGSGFTYHAGRHQLRIHTAALQRVFNKLATGTLTITPANWEVIVGILR